MMKLGSIAALAATTAVMFGGLSVSAPTDAEAGWRHGYRHAPAYRHGYGGPRGYHYGRNRGLNAGLGIAAGALAIGAIAAATSPGYGGHGYGGHGYGASGYGYQPSYGYAQPVYYAPRCRIRNQTVWDPYYGYVTQPVRICR